MKSEVKYLPLWVLPLLFVLLQKSGAKPTTCIDTQCGSITSCALKKCVVSSGATITSVTIFRITQKCFKPWTFGYFKDYLWTTGCCLLRAHVCYGTSSQINGDAVIVSTSTTRTPSSIRSVSATTTDQGSNDFEDNDFTIISTMTMVQASPFEMNMAQRDQDVEENTNIALKIALPVGIFVLVILLAVLGFIFRRKVKGLMGKFWGPCDKSPDLLNPMYGINGPALEHKAGDTFDNLTYAMQTGQENMQSGKIPTGGYDYAKPLPQTNENKSKTVGDSSVSKYQPQYEEVGLKKPCDLYDTTYQPLSGERCNASYDRIMGSNADIMTSPHARLGETAYDNAAI